ncbi:hypothetical protein Tsp_06208 [Trichinella spiralis]|uniref:hypothetical protein n=1 Tax=Trichinella spiralis TaxID=6334 RepID=UPI0001EFB727|nr:hypothetical protein Tsp_06208 [Trichinella spiralis]
MNAGTDREDSEKCPRVREQGRALFRVEPKAHGAGRALDFAQLLLHNPDGWGEQRDIISIPLQGSPWRTPTDQRAVTWVPLAPLTTIVASLYRFLIKDSSFAGRFEDGRCTTTFFAIYLQHHMFLHEVSISKRCLHFEVGANCTPRSTSRLDEKSEC